jgi:uncharacterized protein YkwD
MRPVFLAVMLAVDFALAACGPVNVFKKSGPATLAGKTLAAAVLRESNRVRQAAGLSTLRTSPALEQAADEHARFLMANIPPGQKLPAALAHYDFAGRSTAVMLADSLSSSAEIVAVLPCDQSAAPNVLRVWMASPGHRQKLLGPWQLAGAGAAKAADGSWYVVEWLGSSRS